MATARQSQCSSCMKEKGIYKCEECSQMFCSECLSRHEQELGSHFHRIEYNHDEIRQILSDQKKDLNKHPSMMKIDQWERESKKVIEQKADECRLMVRDYANQVVTELENQLNDIAKNFTSIRQENLFNETHVKEFQGKLDKLLQELNNSSAISIETQSTSLVPDILVKYSK